MAALDGRWRPFVTTATSGGLPINNTTTSTQFSTCVNDSIGYRLGRYVDTAANQNGFFGAGGGTATTIANIAQLNSDFVPTPSNHKMRFYIFKCIILIFFCHFSKYGNK